jgi:hypothetical protein
MEGDEKEPNSIMRKNRETILAHGTQPKPISKDEFRKYAPSFNAGSRAAP